MEIYSKDKVEIRMRYDVENKKTHGDIYYKKTIPAGKVIGDQFYIDTNFILHKGIIKINEVEEVARSCEALREEIEDYSNMWKQY